MKIALNFLLFTLFALSNYSVQAQFEDKPQLNLSSDKHSAFVEVPDKIFSGIEDWLTLSNKDLALDQHLINLGVNSEDIEYFKLSFFKPLNSSDKNSPRSSNSIQCNCKAIVPTGILPQPQNSSPNQKFKHHNPGPSSGIFSYKWKAYEKRWQNHGLSSDFFIRTWSHDLYSALNEKQAGSAVFRIINLCTDQAFLRDDLCNCDKFIEYDGEFRNQINTELDYKRGTLYPSSSRYAFKSTYFLYKAEHNPNKPKNSEILDSKNWEAAGTMDWGIDWTKLGDDVGDALAVVEKIIDTNYAPLPSHLSSFIKNISAAPKVSINNPWANHTEVEAFTGWDTLKANIPMYFVAAHGYSGIVETKGRADNNAQIRYRSAFYWSFKIANSEAGYDIDGDYRGIFSRCCNEDVVFWDLHNDLLSGDLNGGIPQMASNMQYNLNRSLLGAKAFNFEASSYGSSILTNGFLDFRAQIDHFSKTNKGTAYTVSQCGCETFTQRRQDPQSGELIPSFIYPEIRLEPNHVCPGHKPSLDLLNISALPSSGCPIQVTVSHEKNGVIYNSIANGSNLRYALITPGVYTVTYTDSCSNCAVSSQIELLECVEANNQLNCIWNKSNTYPNPIPLNYDGPLNIEVCLADCLEDSDDLDAMLSMHSSYFPASFEILDLQGNSLYRNPSILKLSSLNSNNCFSETIDLNQIANFPLPAGVYMQKITFATGEVRTKILSVN